MSRPIEFGKPHSSAMWRLAMAPAAMPEPARRAAKSLTLARRHHAAAGVEQQQIALVAAPASADRRGGWCSRPRTGLSAALTTVVEKRSCSKISGSTSDEIEIGTSGSSSCRICFHAPLVGAVDVGVHEADGDGRDVAAFQDAGDLARAGFIERR